MLKYVEESGCLFIRNDKEYDSKYSAEHIRKKYVYFKDRINTPEEFIELCATRSRMSGRPYLVRCGETKTIPTGDWLTVELNNFRGNNFHGDSSN